MAKFITFNGTKFFNVENVASIEVKTHERVLSAANKRKEYLYYTVELDGVEAFQSLDFKTYEGKYKTAEGMEDFRNALNYVIEQIEDI